MDLLYEHKNGAKLYQCGALEIPGTPENFYYGWDKSDQISKKEKLATEKSILSGLKKADINVLILASTEYQPAFNTKTLEVINIPFDDAETEHMGVVLNQINPSVTSATKAMLDGKNVLSTCWAGINRSSLISGLILKSITDLSGKEVIDLIRKNRDSYCLCNRSFFWTLY